MSTRVAHWLEHAQRVTPGGVHSPVRAFRAAGVEPLAIVAAHDAVVIDTHGREYVDWIGAWGPALLGHAHAGVREAVEQAARNGLLFGLASPAEVELCERLQGAMPALEMVRLVTTGTEATLAALRLARAFTGRTGLVKFAGCYHGHGDPFLVEAGSGAATHGTPSSPGVPAGVARDTHVARYNDLADVDRAFAAAPGEIAAVIVEPVAGNMGCVPPAPGFLAGLRDRCDREGALLIFDEVITGFRLGKGGATARYGVTPDLVTLGKALGGGIPIAAFGGRREVLSRLSPEGPVYQAGTYAANPLAVAAGHAVLDALDRDPGLWARLERVGGRIEAGMISAASSAGVALSLQRVGSMWTPFFASAPVRSWDDARSVSRDAWGAFFRCMLRAGVLLPPSPFECAFVSAAHGEREIERTIEAADQAMREATC
jgi:glutamate-1-semialdehyde 2,1-aminomutase